MSSSDNKHHYYIYELPYRERKILCNILDINDKWEELGGMYMKFDCATLYKLSKAVMRNRSPSDELLCLWGTQNHTVLDLFVLLSKMHHYQAMRILKPFVDSKYHHLIYEGEDHISQLVSFKDSGTIKESSNTRMEEIDLNRTDQNRYISNKRNKNQTSEGHMNIPNGSVVSGAKNKLAPIKEVESKILNVEQLPNSIDKTAYNIERRTSDVSSVVEACTPLISYKELEVSTNGWDRSTILGKGGFGVVFKGTWKNTAVAIKRLEPQKGNEMEFNILEVQRQQSLKELRYLNTYRHDNILPLYGYSIGGDKPCLVYQYMPNGSLEDRLQCRHGTKPLSWFLRHKIATGSARGLQFLHGIDKPLVHGDIKSANILLDPYYEPRIGDFGLAREGPLEQYTHVKVSRVHGTRPYLPDEFLRGKKFSTKVDTYSFGVVLFEIATGLRAYDDTRQSKYLKDYVDGYDESHITNLIDQKAGPDDAHIYPAIIALGKWCVRTRPKDRPDMVQVLRQLDGMMAAVDMANRAHLLVRQNSLTPSNPYEVQLLHDHHTQLRRLSLSPSGSYHPQPWLFASLAVSNPAATNRRSPSPTNQGVTNGSPPVVVSVQPPLVSAANDVNVPETVLPTVKTMPIPHSTISTHPGGIHLQHQPPPCINVFPPGNAHLSNLLSKSSDYSSSVSDATSNQESLISLDSHNVSFQNKQNHENLNKCSESNDECNFDPILPLISELNITEDAPKKNV